MAGWYLMPHNYHLVLHFWCSLLEQSMRELRLLSNLCSLLMTVQTSKMSIQVPEQACKEGFARCQGLWQNQCHNKISMVGTRCTRWRHKLCVSMTTTICTTAILTFMIACVILLHSSQKWWETLCAYIKRYISQMLRNSWKLSWSK